MYRNVSGGGFLGPCRNLRRRARRCRPRPRRLLLYSWPCTSSRASRSRFVVAVCPSPFPLSVDHRTFQYQIDFSTWPRDVEVRGRLTHFQDFPQLVYGYAIHASNTCPLARQRHMSNTFSSIYPRQSSFLSPRITIHRRRWQATKTIFDLQIIESRSYRLSTSVS